MKHLALLLLLPIQLLAQSSLTIRHINVVDVRTGAIQRNQRVVIKDHKIADIRQDSNNRSLTTSNIDGTNKYLIPGLWDMHVHNKSNQGNWQYAHDFTIPISLANGITGIRSMWGSKAEIQRRDSVNRNLLVAPRIIVGSPLVNGPAVFFNGSIAIKNVNQVPSVVDSLHNIGYDFIKVYSLLRSDIFFALAKYCKEKNIPIAGHVPFGVTIQQAVAAGLKSVEHFTGLHKSFSGQEENLGKQWEKEAADTTGFLAHFNILKKAEFSTAIPFDSLKAKKVAAALITNHTAVVPTIPAIRGWSMSRNSLLELPALAYVSKARQQEWYNSRGNISMEKGAFQNSLELVNFLHKQGVMILAGSDCENPYTVHGFALHDELEFYVKAGLTPLQALQTATLNPATFLNKQKELGTVTKGKLADMVILNGNPLENINNTRKIQTVIMNGHLIDKSKIDKSLHQLKERASR